MCVETFITTLQKGENQTMKTKIYCTQTKSDIHSFYLITGEQRYYMFSQNYRTGVHKYFKNGVLLNDAMKHSKTHKDHALIRTMNKIPMYIKYIEKEYDVQILEKTKRKNKYMHAFDVKCA